MHSDRNTPEVWKLSILLYTAEWGGRLLYTTDGGSGVVPEEGQSQGSIIQVVSVGEYESVVDTSAHTSVLWPGKGLAIPPAWPRKASAIPMGLHPWVF